MSIDLLQVNIRQLKAGMRMVPSIAGLGRKCAHMLVVSPPHDTNTAILALALKRGRVWYYEAAPRSVQLDAILTPLAF